MYFFTIYFDSKFQVMAHAFVYLDPINLTVFTCSIRRCTLNSMIAIGYLVLRPSGLLNHFDRMTDLLWLQAK